MLDALAYIKFGSIIHQYLLIVQSLCFMRLHNWSIIILMLLNLVIQLLHAKKLVYR